MGTSNHKKHPMLYALVFTAAVSHPVRQLGGTDSNGCCTLSANMAINNLQKFTTDDGKPQLDTNAYGVAPDIMLCKNGTIMFNHWMVGFVSSPLIASHIHKGDEFTNGPPVINACGTNSPELLQLNPDYVNECGPMNSDGVYTGSSVGKVVRMGGEDDPNEGLSDHDVIKNICKDPSEYYLNFHSSYSWLYWKQHGGKPVGMCRGQLGWM